MNGRVGAESVTACTAARNSGSTGSIIDEWNACDVFSSFVVTPSFARRCCKAAIAADGPETTVDEAVLTAAIESCLPSDGSRSPAPSGTDSIEPGAADCIRRPRAATSASASGSVMTPARHAATYSPRLWPIMADGVTPHDIHNCASAYSTANSAGCATAAWINRSAASSIGH
jgi:hypothetical protein